MGMGNESLRTLAGTFVLDGAHARRSRGLAAMVSIWLIVGDCCTKQHYAAFVSSCCRIVGLVQQLQKGKAIPGPCRARFGRFLCLSYAVADPRLSQLRNVHLH